MSIANINVISAAIVIATGALFATAAQASQTYPNSVFGTSAPENSAVKHVDISQGKRAVNVNDGDTVEFTKDGKSFTWHFSTLEASPELRLSAIAPSGFDAGSVKIYVKEDLADAGA